MQNPIASLAASSKELGGLRPGHLALEEAIDFRRLLDIPAWEKSGERQFRKHHEIATAVLRLPQQLDVPEYRLAPGVRPRDRSHLRRADDQRSTRHGAIFPSIPELSIPRRPRRANREPSSPEVPSG